MPTSSHGLFEAVLTVREIPTDPRIPALIWWAKRMAELGLTPSYGLGDHGNLSCRTSAGLIITARATMKAALDAEHVVEILSVTAGETGVKMACRGLHLPSTDTLLHWQIYERRRDVHAIFHGHDPQTLAHAEALRLPITTISASRPSLEVINEASALAASVDYLLLRDHGFVALGTSPDDAGEKVRMLATRARSL